MYTGDDISSMSVEQTMTLVRRLGLLEDVNRIVWRKLVEMGMYQGSPNPEIPVANKYPREKILGMDTWTDWFVQKLDLLPEVKQMVTAASTGLQFTDLPPEIQAGILGRASPTAREGTLVSRQMKELADAALMANIRTGNLVDPTIGIPERDMYFKLDARGNGEYFSPEPGLWRAIRNYASPLTSGFAMPSSLRDLTEPEISDLVDHITSELDRPSSDHNFIGRQISDIIDHMAGRSVPALVYGQLDFNKLRKKYPRIPRTGSLKIVGLVSMPYYDPSVHNLVRKYESVTGEDMTPDEIRLYSKLSDYNPENPMILRNIITYGNNNVEFVFDDIHMGDEDDLEETPFWQILKSLNEARGEEFKIDWTGFVDASEHSSEYIRDMKIRVVALNEDDLKRHEIILPSLELDTYIL